MTTKALVPWCHCGWQGRRRKITAENRKKTQADMNKHAKVCKGAPMKTEVYK